MKVAYFLGTLNRGGAETLILDICRQHEQLPFEFVCLYRREGNMSEAFKTSGASLKHIPKRKSLLLYIIRLRKWFKREDITIVHSQTASNTLLLALALCGTGIKVVTSFHGHLFADAAWWKRKIVYAASDKIICVSEYQKRYYEQKWGLPEGNKLEVAYNGIDFTKFDRLEPREDLTFDIGDWTFDKNSGIRLCMVGNFVKGRSQMVIVKALHKLKEKREKRKEERGKWDFYFIGRKDNGQERRYDDCVQYCEKNQLTNVHFLGGREDVPELLRTMDGFVYSTEHDTFGIAVVEAIAAGIPIVVNDHPVMKEVCGVANEGIRYFRTDDAEGAAAQIEAMMADLEKSKQAAAANAKRVREQYSIEKHIERLNEVYALLENKPR